MLALLRDVEPQTRLFAWSGTRQSPPTSPATTHDDVEWQRVDILDRARVREALEAISPDRIFHLAGAAHVAQSWTDTATPLSVNVIGTHVLLDELRLAGSEARVVVAGSSTIYAPHEGVLTETDRVQPASPYALSKFGQELLARRVAQEDGREVIVARSFNHIGPGQQPSYFSSAFARQLAAIERGLAPPVLRVGNLEARRDLTDVRDTVRAYRALMERGRPGGCYNVCSGRAWAIRDVLDLLVARCRVPVTIEPDPALLRPSDTPVVLGSNELVRRETGWQPAIPISQTIADILDDARTNVTTT